MRLHESLLKARSWPVHGQMADPIEMLQVSTKQREREDRFPENCGPNLPMLQHGNPARLGCHREGGAVHPASRRQRMKHPGGPRRKQLGWKMLSDWVAGLSPMVPLNHNESG